MRGMSSAMPRNRVMARCEWVLTRPGRIRLLPAFSTSPEESSSSSSSAGPTAAMCPSVTATAPFLIGLVPGSIVSTVPPTTSMSQLASLPIPNLRAVERRTPTSIQSRPAILLQALFQAAKIAAFPFLWCSSSTMTLWRRREPLHAAELELLGCRGWGVVVVELSRTRFSDVGRLELQHLDDSAVAARHPDDDPIAGSDRTVGFPVVTVDLDSAATTGCLRL